ncbi:nitroreductase [Intrasporangium oryzae NRRL B-24470]|uniref:Nitroreductase n=1 Tax=Intrasporangium oryzae NRRL B-24470 TaxID=1386089 RepID=W9G8S8_9MICO|nr:nitroreductase family deazaflavin-dependent oxidoreductase [Intrasporangium oryzae]EWT02455.1 nitroreductase [Intrasporangium oryzae NRRL B-24470]
MAVRVFEEATATQRAVRWFGATGPGSWLLKRTLHHVDRAGHRLAPHRRTFSGWIAGAPVGMLTTTGARSGLPRTVPLLMLPFEEGWGVIASCFGQERPPAWYFNLLATPEATLELDDVTHAVVAEHITGDERDRLRELAVSVYPGYAVYEQRAGGRDLGFFLLRPATAVHDVAEAS